MNRRMWSRAWLGWAIQREGGARGYVMTGVDWHRNLQIDAYRRVLLNGIVWAAPPTNVASPVIVPRSVGGMTLNKRAQARVMTVPPAMATGKMNP